MIAKTKWPPWPPIGWDMFDFSSETAEQNSMKLDRKQDLNILYQVCVFWAVQKQMMSSSLASSLLAKRLWYVPPTNPWPTPTRFIQFNGALYRIQKRGSEKSNQWNDSIYWCLGERFLGNPHCWPSNRSQEILFDFKTTLKNFIYLQANPIHIKDFFPFQTKSALIIHDVKIYVTV